jgi:dCTP deaminase
MEVYMILTGKEIEKQVRKGRIIISNFDPKNLGANSYDLSLSKEMQVDTATIPQVMVVCGSNRENEVVTLDKIEPMRLSDPQSLINVPFTFDSKGRKEWILFPGRLYLSSTKERAGSAKHYVPMIDGRSSVARHGIEVHISAGFGDIGWTGHWTLEIRVSKPMILTEGEKVAQVFFVKPIGSRLINYRYRGRYDGSLGLQPSLFGRVMP